MTDYQGEVEWCEVDEVFWDDCKILWYVATGKDYDCSYDETKLRVTLLFDGDVTNIDISKYK